MPRGEHRGLDIASESLEKCDWSISEDPRVTPDSIRDKIPRSVYNVYLELQLDHENSIHLSHSIYYLHDQRKRTI